MYFGTDVKQSLLALKDYIKFDQRALAKFNATASGFWASFQAAFVFAPIYFYILFITYTEKFTDLPTANLVGVMIIEGLAYVIIWLLYPLLIYYLLQSLEKSPRFFTYIVPYNWLHVVQAVIAACLLIIGGLNILPAAAAMGLSFVLAGLMVAYKFYLAREALEISSFGAIGILLADGLMTLIVRSLTTASAYSYLT